MAANRSTILSAAALLGLSLAFTACGSGSPSTIRSTTHRAASAAVRISGYAFHPATLTIKPGTKVTFTNRDQTAHTATSTSSAFDTGTVPPGQSKAITFTHPGTYPYYCQFHAFMRGTIIVK
ncbi:MAG TPA: cupredoxin domain-containing protein [Solirubrobacteraceae bacterium]|nr:cupredoxin domain-containing protein [Solirubrobacteraceae bacterium]